MQWKNLKTMTVVVLCIFISGFVLTALSVVSMRMAYRRAYTEIASSCRKVSLLTVDNARYFCAPVARLEGNSSAPSDSPAPVARPMPDGDASAKRNELSLNFFSVAAVTLRP